MALLYNDREQRNGRPKLNTVACCAAPYTQKCGRGLRDMLKIITVGQLPLYLTKCLIVVCYVCYHTLLTMTPIEDNSRVAAERFSRRGNSNFTAPST